MTTIEHKFTKIGVWEDQHTGTRAPHKPLLLLWALARVQHGLPRLCPFAEVEPELRKLLVEFAPARRSVHPEYPFWWLRSDDIWEVIADGPMEPRQGHRDPKKSELLTKNARGGFLPHLHARIRRDAGLRSRLIDLLLHQHFPSPIHERLLDRLQLEALNGVGGFGAPTFRRAVLGAYQDRCAVCGFSVLLHGMPIGVEACFIKWPSDGGPRLANNGLALCSIHRVAFDSGALSLGDDGDILVSDSLDGDSCAVEQVRSLRGSHLRQPIHSEAVPDPVCIAWHRRWVFRP